MPESGQIHQNALFCVFRQPDKIYLELPEGYPQEARTLSTALKVQSDKRRLRRSSTDGPGL